MPAPDSPAATPRSGVAVITVWFEPHDPDRPRARISAESDTQHRETFAAAGVEEICAAVRNWLDSLHG